MNLHARCLSSLPRDTANEPTLEAAHRRSLRNRPLLARGGKCGCFYCMSTFDASEVVQWVHEDSTARCPHCGIDAVLSSRTDSVTPAFLGIMHAHWFQRSTRIDLSAELMKPQEAARPAQVGSREH
jgi:hypothetical protein